MNANVPGKVYDRRIPAPDDCITRPLIDRRARETPDKIFSLFPDGSSWTAIGAFELSGAPSIALTAVNVIVVSAFTALAGTSSVNLLPIWRNRSSVRLNSTSAVT